MWSIVFWGQNKQWYLLNNAKVCYGSITYVAINALQCTIHYIYVLALFISQGKDFYFKFLTKRLFSNNSSRYKDTLLYMQRDPASQIISLSFKRLARHSLLCIFTSPSWKGPRVDFLELHSNSFISNLCTPIVYSLYLNMPCNCHVV